MVIRIFDGVFGLGLQLSVAVKRLHFVYSLLALYFMSILLSPTANQLLPAERMNSWMQFRH
jgi:hypothetical protein